ncbi:acetyl-CoA C-acyltransferase [Microbulbifer thermotolerans]|uniref:Acetyl-CoA C-acyltransferase n=1 Tax=Microbulbifer thermotolerans TaxID=252514 RepID=A0AB35HUN6_MICTH|nr:acetyl-CoA C-acyltransferase [Microbulbifer thermotolerans]MCX2780763.1 acetyl-CoA C-acyltransferase [Microbulbifer thermotolerans]MCX2800659.1 acetyl-CoA C-acyltransferase [Microbulbifer thermotolerans]MCX2806506.1 acetyl-CoA C-acyltransferase [Microbulbifer thermotolerans]MCX2834278.1 acetyl-CoA C-acyltransferase [Microbulbifer thermotolerans]MCX2841549.1 acetyl-CoA C-acyltransferase [Microbulbifer thermotolerans]
MSDVTSDPVVIVGMARTPMGAMQGGLSEVSAPELGSVAIRAALEDAGVAPADVDEVLMGCVLPAGVGQAPARQASIRAGVPEGTPCTTVNKVCGSGMKTVMMARDALLLGEGRVIVAGGMESMTNAPYLLPKARGGMRLGHGEVKDHMFLDGLENAYDGKLMGNFAENTADKYGFTREEQDAFALESLARAQKAIESGAFEREIAPVTISTRRGDVQVRVDEGPGNARPDKIPQLKPAFRKDGTVTAANASSISDGAAALVLMRRSEAERRGLKVLAVLRGQAQFAHQPEWFTTAPVGAMQKLLERTGWSVDEVDLFEINEAFAVVAMAAMRELNLPHDKVNVNGGACALGHPLGASGARILVTLLAAMEKRDVRRGVASLCIGGGEATAVAIERA